MNNNRDDRRGLPSASSAEKWMHCPASFGRELLEPDAISPESEAGTRLHEAMEGKISLESLSIEEIDLVTLARELEQQALKLTSGDIPHEVFTEKRYWLSHYGENYLASARVDKAFDAYSRGLLIIDYKFGRVVPEAIESNVQMRVQAVCASKSFLNAPQVYFVAIIQPRAPKEKQLTICRYTLDDLQKAESEVTTAACDAIFEKENPQTFRAGSWCANCKFRLKCEAAQGQVSELATMPAKVAELSSERLAQILSLTSAAEKVIESARQEAITRLLNDPLSVPGWRLPEPKRRRELADAQAVYSALSKQLSPEQFAACCKIIRSELEEAWLATNKFSEETQKTALGRLNAILEPLTTTTLQSVHKPIRA